MKITKKQAINVADWHADKACAAYLSGELDLFAYHISIADAFRRWAGL